MQLFGPAGLPAQKLMRHFLNTTQQLYTHANMHTEVFNNYQMGLGKGRLAQWSLSASTVCQKKYELHDIDDTLKMCNRVWKKFITKNSDGSSE